MQRDGQPLCSNIQHLGDVVKRNLDDKPDQPKVYQLQPWGREDQLSLALPALEPHLYLSEARTGYGSILYFAYTRRDGTRKPARKNFPLAMLSEALQVFRGLPDSYIALAEFYRHEPRAAYIARIGANWLDLDTYNIEAHKDRSHEQIVYHILDRCADAMIPCPTLVMTSGRGYYPKWIYDKPLTHYALERWFAIQRELHNKFQSLGSDRASLDATHVLRIERTINTKNGRPAEVVWENRDSSGELVRYDFEFLAFEILQFSRQQLKDLKAARVARKATYEFQLKGQPKKKQTNLRPKSAEELNFARLCDLRKLFGPDMRGPVPEGMRDKVFFLSLCFAMWTHTFSGREEEIAAIWREFAPSLRWREAKGYAASAMRRWMIAVKGVKIEWKGYLVDPRYRWRTQTIIEWLDISPEEQRQLQVMIGPAEKKRREIERYTAGRRAKGQITRAEYESNAARKQIEVEEMVRYGLKSSVIAKETGFSVRWVNKLRKKWE
jgi:hypothetical protein